MPSLVEVLVGCYVAVGVTAFAAVRMHYANRARLCESRWRKACETALFVVGPAIGAFIVGAASHLPMESRWRSGFIIPHALLCFVACFAGWNLAEWLHNRRVHRLMTEAAPLPIAHAVTLPPYVAQPEGVCATCRNTRAVPAAGAPVGHGSSVACPACRDRGVDRGLGDLDAVKCRLRDTLDVLAEIATLLVHAETPAPPPVDRNNHAVPTARDHETLCGQPRRQGDYTASYLFFTKGTRDASGLALITCPACKANILQWPEYHAEWEQAASAHAKAHDAAPRVTPRQAQHRLDAWRAWLCDQPIARQVAQEHIDDLARALAAVKRPP